MNTREEYTTEYLRNVRQANNESAKKELLKTLLVRLFDKDPKARKTIDRYLFRTERQTPTLELIKQDFGETSPTFLFCIDALANHFQEVKNPGEIQTAFEQWTRKSPERVCCDPWCTPMR